MIMRPPTGLVDMNGRAVTFDPGVDLSPETLERMDVVEETGARFEVPSVGLNVPLDAMTMVGNEITPPGFASAYLVRNLGVQLENASDGTVFVAVHSLSNGAISPGNYLIDIENQKADLEPGVVINVDELEYRVTGSIRVDKTNLGEEQSVWANEPGKLVVITCLPRPTDGRSLDNIVITAQLVD